MHGPARDARMRAGPPVPFRIQGPAPRTSFAAWRGLAPGATRSPTAGATLGAANEVPLHRAQPVNGPPAYALASSGGRFVVTNVDSTSSPMAKHCTQLP